MKKSELKEMIKLSFLNEKETFDQAFDRIDKEEEVYPGSDKDSVKETEATEVFTDAELDMTSEMLMRMFDKLGLENNVEKSDALVKYINSWFEGLDFVNEAEEEDVEVDTEEDITLDEPEEDTADAGVEMTGDTKEVQDNLEAALEAAKAMGDQKLVDQIGNSITFFTRTHVVGKKVEEAEMDIEAEVDLDESIARMKKLAGL